jgi:hypothetical protein
MLMDDDALRGGVMVDKTAKPLERRKRFRLERLSRLKGLRLSCWCQFSVCGDARYLAVTALVAEPPRLLRTVMFCGFVAQVNCPLYLPPPSFVIVPMSSPVAVT